MITALNSTTINLPKYVSLDKFSLIVKTTKQKCKLEYISKGNIDLLKY